MKLLQTDKIITPMEEWQMFDGEYSGFQRYDIIRHSDLDFLYEKMRGDFWVPAEINMTQDAVGVPQLPESVQELFRANLLFQTCADSLVTRGMEHVLAKRASDPVVEKLMIVWGLQELIHCYDDDTEILTSEGFIPFTDVTLEHSIANWYPDKRITFTKPTHVLHKKYTGDMVHFKHRMYDLLVTPNHRIPAYTVYNDRFVTKTASEISVMQHRYPLNGTLEGNTKMTPLDKIGVAFQADGCVTNRHHFGGDHKTYHGYMYRFAFTKERKIKRLVSLCEQAGVDYTITSPSSRPEQKHIYLWSPVKFDKDFEWVTPADKSGTWCSEFISELGHWDGYFRKDGAIIYCNTNMHALEKVRFCAVLAGKYTSVDMIDPKDTYRVISKNIKPFYQIYISDKATTHGKTMTKTTVKYDGNIHCVTVPSSYIIVRRNGRICVSGNSDSYSFIVRSVYPDPTAFFDDIQRTPEILSRFEKENAAFNEDTHIEEILLNLLGLEAGKFMMSFLNTYLINEHYPNHIPGSTQVIRLINHDENTHMTAGGKLLQIIRKNPREVGLKESKQENWYRDIMEQVIDDELAWGKYLLSLHQFDGITEKHLEDFIRWAVNRGLKSAKLPTLGGGEATDMTRWFLQTSSINKAVTAGQEANEISYNIAKMKRDW